MTPAATDFDPESPPEEVAGGGPTVGSTSIDSTLTTKEAVDRKALAASGSASCVASAALAASDMVSN